MTEMWLSIDNNLTASLDDFNQTSHLGDETFSLSLLMTLTSTTYAALIALATPLNLAFLLLLTRSRQAPGWRRSRSHVLKGMLLVNLVDTCLLLPLYLGLGGPRASTPVRQTWLSTLAKLVDVLLKFQDVVSNWSVAAISTLHLVSVYYVTRPKQITSGYLGKITLLFRILPWIISLPFLSMYVKEHIGIGYTTFIPKIAGQVFLIFDTIVPLSLAMILLPVAFCYNRREKYDNLEPETPRSPSLCETPSVDKEKQIEVIGQELQDRLQQAANHSQELESAKVGDGSRIRSDVDSVLPYLALVVSCLLCDGLHLFCSFGININIKLDEFTA